MQIHIFEHIIQIIGREQKNIIWYYIIGIIFWISHSVLFWIFKFFKTAQKSNYSIIIIVTCGKEY